MSFLAAAVLAGSMNCWAAASIRYDLPVDLLYAIGQVESSHKPHAIGVNKNGTRDIGIMQINSSWLPVLKDFGIAEQQLLEPCTNIQVGAWILSQEVQRFGYTWQAIGAYNAGPITSQTSERARIRKLAIYRIYSGKVLKRWRGLALIRAEQRKKQASPTTNKLQEVANVSG